jgi:hypothetical protein
VPDKAPKSIQFRLMREIPAIHVQLVGGTAHAVEEVTLSAGSTLRWHPSRGLPRGVGTLQFVTNMHGEHHVVRREGLRDAAPELQGQL